MVALWTIALAVCEPADGRMGVGSIECASLEPVERRAVAASTLGTLDVLRGWLLHRAHVSEKPRAVASASRTVGRPSSDDATVRNGLERRYGRRLGQRVQIRRDRCGPGPPRAMSNQPVSPRRHTLAQLGGRPKTYT